MGRDFEDSAAEFRAKILKKYKLSLSLFLLLYNLHIINFLISNANYSSVNGNLLRILQFANFHNLHTLLHNGPAQKPLYLMPQ